MKNKTRLIRDFFGLRSKGSYATGFYTLTLKNCKICSLRTVIGTIRAGNVTEMDSTLTVAPCARLYINIYAVPYNVTAPTPSAPVARFLCIRPLNLPAPQFRSEYELPQANLHSGKRVAFTAARQCGNGQEFKKIYF